MRRPTRHTAEALAGLCLLTAPLAACTDDGGAKEESTTPALVEPLDPRWTADSLHEATSTVFRVGDRLVYPGTSTLTARNVATGKLAWLRRIDDGCSVSEPGPGGELVVLSGGLCRIATLIDGETGPQRWRTRIPGG